MISSGCIVFCSSDLFLCCKWDFMDLPINICFDLIFNFCFHLMPFGIDQFDSIIIVWIVAC